MEPWGRLGLKLPLIFGPHGHYYNIFACLILDSMACLARQMHLSSEPQTIHQAQEEIKSTLGKSHQLMCSLASKVTLYQWLSYWLYCLSLWLHFASANFTYEKKCAPLLVASPKGWTWALKVKEFFLVPAGQIHKVFIDLLEPDGHSHNSSQGNLSFAPLCRFQLSWEWEQDTSPPLCHLHLFTGQSGWLGAQDLVNCSTKAEND